MSQLRIAVLGDLHGNWTALEAVDQALRREPVDVIFGLGDYLNTSTGSRRVVEWMQRRLHAYFIRGNGDSWSYYERFKDIARIDLREQYAYVTTLPERIEVTLQGVTFLLQHRYLPKRPIEQVTVDYLKDEMRRVRLEERLDLDGVDVVCLGDMHVPYIDAHEQRLALHPGSVGAPMGSVDARNRAAYAILEIDARELRVYCRSVAFSRAEAVREMNAATVPDVTGADLALSGLLYGRPPFEDKGWRWEPAANPLRVPRA